MTPKIFTGLAVAAVASLLLGALVHARSDAWVSGAPTGAKLLPSLPKDAARIGTVSIKQGAKSLVLERKGEDWSLKNSGGYPVPGRPRARAAGQTGVRRARRPKDAQS